MPGFETRFERLELKFVIDELQAERVRRRCAAFCDVDPHSRQRGVVGYPISSLYLDTPSLAFHRAKERGDPNRVKIRVRTYSHTSPAILELKRRHSDVIDKSRLMVDRDHVVAIVHGRDWPTGLGPEAEAFLGDFAGLIATSGAGPTLTVRYEREAYSSVVDDYARITFDRGIRARRTEDWNLSPDTLGWCHFDDHWRTDHRTTPVVLEIKCRSLVPLWVVELIRDESLRRVSFSKYSIGIGLTDLAMGHRDAYSRSAKALG